MKKRIMSIFNGMKQRCNNPNNPNYKYYGGRGIRVCEEWIKSPNLFYEWAITHGYAENLTIDRIDNDGNYEPSNCRWVTKEEQAYNKRNTIIITYNGVSHTVLEWSRITGIDKKVLAKRYNNGYTEKEILYGKTSDNILKELRNALGYTQAEFAEVVGVTRETIANYECYRREPNATFFKILQDKFKVSNAFIGGAILEFATKKRSISTDH